MREILFKYLYKMSLWQFNNQLEKIKKYNKDHFESVESREDDYVF